MERTQQVVQAPGTAHTPVSLTAGQSAACDLIRYLGALMVAVHHLPNELKPEAYAASDRLLTNLGLIGVTVFFVLSGLLISHTVARKSSRSDYTFPHYLMERSVRIFLVFVPALMLIVAAGAVSAATGFGADSSEWRKFDLWHFATNLLMLSGVRPIVPHQVTFSFMEQSWSLNYEYFFYILFGAAVLPLHARRGTAIRMAIFAATALLVLLLPKMQVLVLGLS